MGIIYIQYHKFLPEIAGLTEFYKAEITSLFYDSFGLSDQCSTTYNIIYAPTSRFDEGGLAKAAKAWGLRHCRRKGRKWLGWV
jgi:hypothetical protein